MARMVGGLISVMSKSREQRRNNKNILGSKSGLDLKKETI